MIEFSSDILYRVISASRSEELNEMLERLPQEHPERLFRVLEFSCAFSPKYHEMVYAALVAWLPKPRVHEELTQSTSNPDSEPESGVIERAAKQPRKKSGAP